MRSIGRRISLLSSLPSGNRSRSSKLWVRRMRSTVGKKYSSLWAWVVELELLVVSIVAGRAIRSAAPAVEEVEYDVPPPNQPTTP